MSRLGNYTTTNWYDTQLVLTNSYFFTIGDISVCIVIGEPHHKIIHYVGNKISTWFNGNLGRWVVVLVFSYDALRYAFSTVTLSEQIKMPTYLWIVTVASLSTSMNTHVCLPGIRTGIVLRERLLLFVTGLFHFYSLIILLQQFIHKLSECIFLGWLILVSSRLSHCHSRIKWTTVFGIKCK